MRHREEEKLLISFYYTKSILSTIIEGSVLPAAL
jgi:hypothetical protein